MTDISNTDDVIDSRDVIQRIEDLREMCKPWAAGWNMPGYMPDSEPAAFTDWEDARDYILDALRDHLDTLADSAEDDPDIADDLQATIARLEAAEDDSAFGETVARLHYWISENADPLQGLEPEDAAELAALKDLAKQGEDYAADWQYGETLIRDSYFKEYAMELADDIGAVPDNASWPMTCIDWEQAARELRMDYTSIDFDGVTYWIR